MRDRPAGRIGSLDGLRGVAAAVVLLNHSFLVVPSLAQGNVHLPVPDSRAWLVNTPLHLFWAGGEAVFVFFVLSGFVLTLPALRRPQDWIGYFPSRLIRLYLPVWVAVALALALHYLVPRSPVAGQSDWLLRHVQDLSLTGLAGDLSLRSPTVLNSPLWSLKWEVAFSLLLPLFVSVAAVTRRWWWITALGAVALSAGGHPLRNQVLIYLAMFLLGSALAAGWDRIAEVRRLPGAVLLVASCLGLTSEWWLTVPDALDAPRSALVLASAGVLVVLAGKWSPGERFLLGRVPQWLGRISFSLYLVHEPIAVSFGFLAPVSRPWIATIATIPIALVAAVLFNRFVETPSHQLAKSVASRVATATSPARSGRRVAEPTR